MKEGKRTGESHLDRTHRMFNSEAVAFASTALDHIIDGQWDDVHRKISPKRMADGTWVMSYDDNDWVFGKRIDSCAVVHLACHVAMRVATSLSDFKINAIIEESYKKMNQLCLWLIDTHAGDDDNIDFSGGHEIDSVLNRFYPDSPDIQGNTQALMHILLLFNRYVSDDDNLLANMNTSIRPYEKN